MVHGFVVYIMLDGVCVVLCCVCCVVVFFQAEDGIRDLVRSRGLGDVYKRQSRNLALKGYLDDFCEVWPIPILCPPSPKSPSPGSGSTSPSGGTATTLSLIHI